MAIINQSNILNLQPGITAPVVVHMSEGDSGTKLSFKLIDGARAWTDPGNVVAAVHGRRQDGTQFGPYACTISGDVVSFQTDAAIAAVAGSGIAQIVLTDSDQNTAGTANFAIMVERATFPMGVTYTNDKSVYEAILAYVQTIPAAVTEDYNTKIAQEATEREEADAALLTSTTLLRTQLTNEIENRITQDDVLSARMDEFTQLPTGSLSTAADAELVDIRIMADGDTASTAGDAVRNQFTKANAEIAILEDTVYKEEKTYTNTWKVTTSADGYFGAFFESRTFVKSITPEFSETTGSGTVTIYKTSGAVAADKAVTEVETFTFTIGDTITLNRFFDVDEIIMIHGNENAVLRSTTPAYATIDARICRIYNATRVQQTLPDSRFAGTFEIMEPVDLSDVSKTVLFKEQDIALEDQETARDNISAASTDDIVPLTELMDQVYAYPTTYTNTATTKSSAAGYFGFWFEETTYVESVLPTFSAEVGEGTAYVYRAYTNIAQNVYVNLVETITFTIGQPVVLNRYLGPKDIIIIHGNTDSVLKFVNNVNVPLPVRIGRIASQDATARVSSELASSRFAGVFTIREAKPEHMLGKTLMAVGDSLVYGHTLGPARAWPALVGADLGMEVDNRGTNGARMANYQYNSKDNSVYQKVCVSTSEFYISTEDLQAAEVIIIYAGTNDCNHSIAIGDVDSTDPLEFCGAINLICKELQTRAPQSKIAFITPYKRAGIEAQCQQYIDAILAVCDKYSIPVFDNGKNGGICWSNAAITGAMALDTFHLNDAGMKYVSTKYESFIQSL